MISTEFEAMQSALQPILDKLWRHCEGASIRGRTVTLKMKFADFRIITRSRSISSSVNSRDELEAISLDLLRPLLPPVLGVRLLGVSVSNLVSDDRGWRHCGSDGFAVNAGPRVQ